MEIKKTEQGSDRMDLNSAIADAEAAWLIEIMEFLQPEDALRYGMACSKTLMYVTSERLWEKFASSLLDEQERFTTQRSQKQSLGSSVNLTHEVMSALSCLQVPTSRELYCCFRKLRTSMLGWFRILPPTNYIDQPRGGLVHIYRHNLRTYHHQLTSKVVLRVYDAVGVLTKRFSVIYDEDKRGLYCCEAPSRRDYCMSFSPPDCINLRDARSEQDIAYQMKPLRRSVELFSCKTGVALSRLNSVMDTVKGVIGLYSAPYGPHGMELLQVSLVEYQESEILTSIDTAADSSDDDDDDDDDDGDEVFYEVDSDEDDGDYNNENDGDEDENNDDDDGNDINVIYYDALEATNNSDGNGDGAGVNDDGSIVVVGDRTIDDGNEGNYNGSSEHDEDYSDSTEAASEFYFIEGLKIIGDPNVPAGQLSFRVDVTELSDFHAWISADARPIVHIDEHGTHQITWIALRQQDIVAAYRGKGQINIVPGRWQPEWVDITFIIYRTGSTNGAFSVIWDDVGEQFRHMMDFRQFRCAGEAEAPTLDVPQRWAFS
jgi:Cyclin D1 binding domain